MATKYIKENKGKTVLDISFKLLIDKDNISEDQAIDMIQNALEQNEMSIFDMNNIYVNDITDEMDEKGYLDESEDVDPEDDMSEDDEILTEKRPKKIYKSGNWKFRYDDSNNRLVLIDPEDGSEIDSMGLSKDDWNDNPQYWCDAYADSLDSEIANIDLSEFEESIEDYSDDPIEIIDVTSEEPDVEDEPSNKLCPMCGNSVDLCTCNKEESLIPNLKVRRKYPRN